MSAPVEVMFSDICATKPSLSVDFLNDLGESSPDVMTFVGFSLVRLTGFGVVTLFLFWGDGEVSLSVTSSSEVDSLLRMLGRLSFLLSLVSIFLGF